MFSQRIGEVMQSPKLLVGTPVMTVTEAARAMAERGVSAIVVVEDEAIAGIFTERDAVQRVIARGLDPQATRLAQVMTARPFTLTPDKSFGHALATMHERGIRHVPVVEGGRPVGIISARDALDPELEEFVCETRRRSAFR